MNLICEQGPLRGGVEIPGSKSHTIRAVAIAALAQGESCIREPLVSSDTQAAVRTYRSLGVDIDTAPGVWRVSGTGGALQAPDNVIDVGNSGTTLRVAMGSAALLHEGAAVFTGDHQIRSRPGGPLAQSLTDLGARVMATRPNGCAPFVVEGRLRGGETSIEAVTSQYLSSLLMAAPLADGDSLIRVPLLNEAPYVGITLDWLTRQGIEVRYEDMAEFHVPGGQHYAPVERRIPADFSSATFFLAASAIDGNSIAVRGLDMNDTQGDRVVVEYLERMGADVRIAEDAVHVKADGLTGCEIDLNATPDALPMMAVLACFAAGETRLVNVPQARLKETDRIAVMCEELSKLGAKITELPDGLVVEQSTLQGAAVDGHDDHRVVMSLAIAGCAIAGTTTIRGYESVEITYPGFAESLQALGGKAQFGA